MQKLNRYFMEGQNTDGVWKDAENLVEFIGFSLFSFGFCVNIFFLFNELVY